MKRLLTLALACTALGGVWAQDGYQTVKGPHTFNPGEWPAHYPFADRTEAAVAAPEVHHVRYVDSHVRLVEVAYFPGVIGNMHGHPFPSVFAVDAPAPKATNIMLDPKRNMVAVKSEPPEGAAYPICRAASPQFPHHETNLDSWPHHFYRLEFLRIGDADFGANWADWSRYAIAGPDRSRLLYDSDHIRLVEILIRPGETRRAVPNRYPSVIATDVAMPFPSGTGLRVSPPLAGFDTLKCSTASASPAEVTRNTGTVPIHYYRIDFKRIDGDGLKDHWRDWYPWMAALKEAYDRSPNTPNF